MNKLLVVLLSVAALASCNYPKENTETETAPKDVECKESEQVLRHVVLFKWVDDITPEKKTELIEHFGSLKDKIDVIKDFEYGEDVSVEGISKGYTHCFIVTFADTAGRNAYIPHPDHKVFGDSVIPYLKDVLVVDYLSEE